MELLFKGIDEEESNVHKGNLLPEWAYSVKEIRELIEEHYRQRKHFKINIHDLSKPMCKIL